MTGFTLYETLRVFVPGALAVLLVDLVARVAVGPDPFAADGGAKALVETIESVAVFAVLALLAGLLLYLVDFPSRLRISAEGDQSHGSPLPSAELRDMITNSDLRGRSLSLYFLLSDRYLSTEFHKRVYLFGSLFRVFVDLRLLLAIAAVAGPFVALVMGRTTTNLLPAPRWPSQFTVVFAAMVSALIAIGSYGVLEHRLRFRRRRLAERAEGSEVEVRPFRSELIGDIKEFLPATVTIAAAMTVGSALIAWIPGWWAGAGLVPLLAGFSVWVWVELGPVVAKNRELLVRGRVLSAMGSKKDAAQFSSAQRLLADLALLVPMLGFAVNVAINVGWQPVGLLAWGIFIYPCTAIMALRKHEVRLLNIYRDQATWLILNRQRIQEINSSGQLPASWG